MPGGGKLSKPLDYQTFPTRPVLSGLRFSCNLVFLSSVKFHVGFLGFVRTGLIFPGLISSFLEFSRRKFFFPFYLYHVIEKKERKVCRIET